jgi:hypothetical protein
VGQLLINTVAGHVQRIPQGHGSDKLESQFEGRVDQRSFFFIFNGVWLGEGGEVVGRGIGIGESGWSGEGWGVGQDFVPVLGLVGERILFFDVGEGREHDLAEAGESGGFANGDAVLGDGDEEFTEDVVDVSGGEEIAMEGSGDFAAEALGLELVKFLAGMEGAEGSVGRVAQHAAAAAVGELELAARGCASARILDRHGSLLGVDLCQSEIRN